MDDLAEEIAVSATDNAITAYVRKRYGIPVPAKMNGAKPTIKDVFDPQAQALHCTLSRQEAERKVGITWKISPSHGSGSYWYFAIDNGCAICSFSMSFTVNETVSCTTPPFVCLGAYSRTMTPYFGLDDEHAQRTVLGYSWNSPRYTQFLSPGGTLAATSILLLPEATKRMSLVLGCTPEELQDAICSVDASIPSTELSTLLNEADKARPSKRTAQAYYTAKIVEALTIVLDRRHELEKPSPTTRPLSSADRAALARIRQAIDENPALPLTNDVLCQLVFMSESKLTRLFKRVEGVTPQEYIRKQRMEHARHLIESSTLSLAEIAHTCGFKRPGSFSEAFRERYGCTPRAFRAIHKTQ